MSLRYRGISYTPTQSPAEVSEAFTSHYRGAVVTRHNLKHAVAQRPTEELQYRGVTIK